MEEQFLAAWAQSREQARALGVRLRPLGRGDTLNHAKRNLQGRRYSEGFQELAQAGHLELTLEALAVDKAYTALFSDEEVNEALDRLLQAAPDPRAIARITKSR